MGDYFFINGILWEFLGNVFMNFAARFAHKEDWKVSSKFGLTGSNAGIFM